jgi:hypothetical protein
MCYTFFKVLAAIYCDTDIESNHIQFEEWVLLLVKHKANAEPRIY